MTAPLAPMKRHDRGDGVVELQMRLAGFHGGVPDGDYGPGTELQVASFQRDFMQVAAPTGEADQATLDALDEFARQFPVDFAKLRCPCGTCGGFGKGRFKGVFRQPGNLEVFNRYEYPGMHRMLLWGYRAAAFYALGRGWKLTINSGYRCENDNAKHQRTSTNHHGKAIDMDIVPPAGAQDTDAKRCNALRGLLVERANAQIGWNAPNRKSLEPANVAPTWVHMDVRSYDRRYLDDRYFVKDTAALDAVPA